MGNVHRSRGFSHSSMQMSDTFFRKTKKKKRASQSRLTCTFSHFLFNFCVNWVLSALKGGVGVFLSSMQEDHEKKILFVVLAVDNKCQIISVSKMSCRQGKGWSTDNLPCVKSSNVPHRCFFKIIFLTFSHSCFLLHFEIIRSVSWVWLKYFSAGGRLFYITRSQYVLFWQHVPKSCFSQTSVNVGVIHNLLRADLLFCCLHALRGDTLFFLFFVFFTHLFNWTLWATSDRGFIQSHILLYRSSTKGLD